MKVPGSCHQGFYRWSINFIAYDHSRLGPGNASAFDTVDDEQFITTKWPVRIAPHRVGVVGDALVVHFMVSCAFSCQPWLVRFGSGDVTTVSRR